MEGVNEDALNAPFFLPSPNAAPQFSLMETAVAFDRFSRRDCAVEIPSPTMGEAEGGASLAITEDVIAAATHKDPRPDELRGSATPTSQVMNNETGQTGLFDRGSSSLKRAPSIGHAGYMPGDLSGGMSVGGHYAQFELLADVYSFMEAPAADADNQIELDQPSIQPASLNACDTDLGTTNIGYALHRLPERVPRQIPFNTMQQHNEEQGQQGQLAMMQMANLLAGMQEQIGVMQVSNLQIHNTALALKSAIEGFSEITSGFASREAAVAARELAAQNMLSTAMEMLAAVTKKTTCDRKAEDSAKAPFNWLHGDGLMPRKGRRAASSNSRFDRIKANVRGFGCWILYKAIDNELKDPWIKYEDAPRVTIDGLYLRDFLKNKVEMSAEMGRAVVRVLRMDEAARVVGPDGHTHYVMHDWAKMVLETDYEEDAYEDLFIQPRFHYDIATCGKVVAMVLIDGQWASLSVNMSMGVTHLIHPGQSDKSYSDVLDAHRPMMIRITKMILAHMKKLANKLTPEGKWHIDVALKKEHTMVGQDTGISTAFYSIPKNNQFLIELPATIALAKQTLIYSAVNACVPVTKKFMHKAKKPRMPTKRDRDGKGKYAPDSPSYIVYSDDDSVAESNAP